MTLKKLSLHKKDSLETRVSRYLFTYRITPHTVTGISSAEMLMGRRLRSALDLIKPDIGRKFEESRESMMLKRKTMLRKFEILCRLLKMVLIPTHTIANLRALEVIQPAVSFPLTPRGAKT